MRIESPQDIGWASTLVLNRSEIRRPSMPSVATVEYYAKPGQYSLHEKKIQKKLRTLAPTPPPPRRAPTPRPPKEEIFVDENGRHKIRIPRRYPLASHNDPASSPANSTNAQPLQEPSNIPLTCSESPSLQFDPSQCVWHALRDVAFVKDDNIQLSMEDLCALLRFRYSEKDARMKRVEACHVLAMSEFVRERGMRMYEVKFPRFIRREMEVDLRSMREGEL